MPYLEDFTLAQPIFYLTKTLYHFPCS